MLTVSCFWLLSPVGTQIVCYSQYHPKAPEKNSIIIITLSVMVVCHNYFLCVTFVEHSAHINLKIKNK